MECRQISDAQWQQIEGFLPGRLPAAIQLAKVEDVTSLLRGPSDNLVEEVESTGLVLAPPDGLARVVEPASLNKPARSMRPPMDFGQLGIGVGEEL